MPIYSVGLRMGRDMGDGINWFSPGWEEIDLDEIVDGKHIDELLKHLERETEREKQVASNQLLRLVEPHITSEQRAQHMTDLDTIAGMIREVRGVLIKSSTPPEKLSMRLFILGALIGGIGRNISESRMSHSAVDLCRQAMESKKSEAGKKAANAKHELTKIKKKEVLAEWDATFSEYESRADFARIIGQRDGIKERTLCNWIADHEKSKAQPALPAA